MRKELKKLRKELKKLRVEYDLTQEQMAAQIGVTRTTYCNIENAKSNGSTDFWLALKREFPKIDIEVMAEVKAR